MFQIGINYSTGFFSFSFLLVHSFFSCFSLLFFCSLPPSTVGPSGAFSTSDPAPWKGRVTLLRRAHQTCVLVLLHSGVFRSGDRWPSRKFCTRKSGPPQSGLLEIHARVQQVVLFQDDRMHRQEFRAVLFPFYREDLHRFSLRVQAVSPYRRKTPRPMGS